MTETTSSPRRPRVRTLEYLAAPYMHERPIISAARAILATRAAATLIKADRHIFSPLSMSHDMSQMRILDKRTPDDWLRLDFAVLAQCKTLLVLQLKGHQESYGVGKEITYAGENAIPMEFLTPSTYIPEIALTYYNELYWEESIHDNAILHLLREACKR